MTGSANAATTRSADEIVDAQAWLCDLAVPTVRTDSLQTFIKQETIFVSVRTASGVAGLGYSYTIGVGGRSVLSLLRESLLAGLIGADIARVEAIWSRCYNVVRSLAPGAVSALALAAIDTAVWDAQGRSQQLPLWKQAGGAKSGIAVYDTEGGWLHLDRDQLVAGAVDAQRRGLSGVKIKVGRPSAAEDHDRLKAVRDAVGPDFDLMVDANQCFTLAEAARRAAMWEPLDLAWFEEPLPAQDVSGHRRLVAGTSIPIAVGETLYSLADFAEYLHSDAVGIIQPDVSRIGGITPWLKAAHLAQAHNVKVAPHFLMELHLPLVCAVANSSYLEHIPQLQDVMTAPIDIVGGEARPTDLPGLGIAWDHAAIERLRVV